MHGVGGADTAGYNSGEDLKRARRGIYIVINLYISTYIHTHTHIHKHIYIPRRIVARSIVVAVCTAWAAQIPLGTIPEKT